jgi:hypothetical protein
MRLFHGLLGTVALGCADARTPEGTANSNATTATGGAPASVSHGTGGSFTAAPASGGVFGTPAPIGGSSPQTGPSFGGTSPQAGGAGGEAARAGAPNTTGKVDLPCEVQAIVGARCAACHSNPTQFGATMPLTTAADFRTFGQRVLVRVSDDALPMPPPPNARLADAEIATLKQWIDAGAPDGTCSMTEPPPGSVEPDPAEELPPDVTCYTLTARKSAAGAKYDVPQTPDLYQCFDYVPPWGDKVVQVVAARPIVDNARVLHHWILYNRTADVTDGATAACAGLHPDAAFITGWAPGGEGLLLPDDVGLRTEAGGFTLELHYNNQVGSGQLDASGVELCVTEKLRPKEAAVHWLGTQSLNKLKATGTCTPVNTEPVTILSSSPHMHLQGRHMKTVINRKGGGTEVLVDKPFDFNTQISYDTPAVIQPGDTLTTTCTYATPTPFGQGTNEEMCYNFVIAYPAGQLGQLLQLLRKYDCTGF